MFAAVIFDWDGTLADTRQVLVKAFLESLRERNCIVSERFIERRIGVGPRLILIDALRSREIPFNEQTINTLTNRKIAIQLSMLDKIQLFEGVVDLLSFLNGRITMALATMSNRRVIDEVLSRKSLDSYFEVVLTFDDIVKSKPDPEVFLKCAKRLNIQPIKCVVVEDSIFGVKAAKKANMKCIAIPSGVYSKQELMEESPDLLVDSIREKQQITDFILKPRE